MYVENAEKRTLRDIQPAREMKRRRPKIVRLRWFVLDEKLAREWPSYENSKTRIKKDVHPNPPSCGYHVTHRNSVQDKPPLLMSKTAHHKHVPYERVGEAACAFVREEARDAE